MELRRQCIIQELNRKNFYEARDGRMLGKLSLEELEVERVRLPEVEFLNTCEEEVSCKE